jgi:hypothetical protein
MPKSAIYHCYIEYKFRTYAKIYNIIHISNLKRVEHDNIIKSGLHQPGT